jgi:uncharacterized protein DUF5670
MLWTIGAILAFLWLLSFVGHAGWWVHLILAIATIGFVVNLLMHDPESSLA